MTVSRLILSMMFLPLAALPCAAQRLAPVALRGSEASTRSAFSEPSSPFVARQDTQPTPSRSINLVAGVIGGVLGGVVGTLAGGFLGAAMAEGCQGEDCSLNVVLGAGIGESIGVAVGAHLGSGSKRHENIMFTSLTTMTVLVAGTALAIGMKESGVVMLPLTPALQLAAALAIQRY